MMTALRVVLIACSAFGAVTLAWHYLHAFYPDLNDEVALILIAFFTVNAVYLLMSPWLLRNEPGRLLRLFRLWCDAKEHELKERAKRQ
jgi:hypothetical protein